MHTGVELLRLDLGLGLFNLHRYEISFHTLSHTESAVEVEHGREWFVHLSAGIKLSYHLSARERRLAASGLESRYAQSGRIQRTQPHCHTVTEVDPRPPDYTTI